MALVQLGPGFFDWVAEKSDDPDHHGDLDRFDRQIDTVEGEDGEPVLDAFVRAHEESTSVGIDSGQRSALSVVARV